MPLAGLLLVSLLADLPIQSDAGRLARDIVSAFQSGDLARLTGVWSERSPTRGADTKRLARLFSERSELSLTAEDEVEPGRVPLVFSNRATVLEKYTLHIRIEDGQPRAWALVSSEAERATRLLAGGEETAPTLSVVRELLHRATEQLEAGHTEQALATLALASEFAQRTGDPSLLAAASLALGTVHQTRGDLPAAVRLFESSCSIAERAADRRGVAKALDRLARSDRVAGEYVRAESRWTEALHIFREMRDRSGEARTLNALGTIRSSVGDYDAARSWYEDGLKIYRQLNDALGISTVSNNLGIDHRLQGRYGDALAHFRVAMDLSRSIDDEEGVAYALNNIGNVLVSQGKYMEGLQAFQQSAAILHRLGSVESGVFALNGIAETYRTLGNTERAIQQFGEAYALAEKIGFKEGMSVSLHNLGQAWLQEDDPQRALQYYTKSLAIDTEVGNRSGMAIALKNIGRANTKLGNVDTARQAFEKSFALAQQMNDRETMTLLLASQAQLARQSNDSVAEIELARRAVGMAAEIGLPELQWEAHLTLGRAHRRAGHLDEARREVDRALTVVEELRRGIPGEELAQQAFESMVLPYHELVGILVEQGHFEAAFEHAEAAKARVLLDVLRHGRPDVSSVITNAEREVESRLVARLTLLNRQYREALITGAPDPEITAKVRQARLDYDAFLTGLYAAHPKLRMERGELAPFRATDITKLLETGLADAVVEFVVTDEKTYVFAMSGELTVHAVPIARSALAGEVRRFRELLARRDLGYAPAARSLYDRLMRPVAAQLRDAKTICIVADGPLWELPFQALQPAEGQFLVDRHAIFYAPSLSVLREMRSRQKPEQRGERLLALGNPVIPTEVRGRVRDVYRDVSLAPIPHSETEIRQIAALYGARASRIHLRESAREEVVKATAGQFDVLHFATHGILDNHNGLDSRLLFSPPESGSEDGLLEAREIMRLDLGADLAVLSACETARGRIGAGEGVIGMSWAFFVAGVPATVVSQWKVDSASTSDLMVQFHRALRSGRTSKAEALRRASQTLRAKPAFRHPFYWAPFVLVGRAD